MNEVYDDLARKAVGLVERLVREFGPRVSGTKGNYAAARELERVLKEICPNVETEPFDIHPDSLFSIGKIVGLSYTVGLAAVVVKGVVLSAVGIAGIVLGLAFCVSQFILYLDLFDKLFPGVKGSNIVGYSEPEGEARRQIILVGHHDSAYVYNFHENLPFLFPLRFFLPVALTLLELVALVLALFVGIEIPIWTKCVLISGLVFVLPMLGYISRRQSPGAGDNLIGCAIGLGILDLFRGSNRLKNTRLALLLTDGEEVGQKGARFFVKKHMKMMKDLETTVINIDSIYEKDDIAILKSDRNGFVRLSNRLSSALEETAGRRGYAVKTRPLPFGGGGTDAGQFAMKGIDTACVIGMPMNVFRKEIVIHTGKDVPGRIRRDAVRAVIEIVSEYIKETDGRESDN